MSFPGGLAGRESTYNRGDIENEGSIPELRRFTGEGNVSSLQYSCLKNHMNRGAWQATVHGVTKSLDTIEWLSTRDSQNTEPSGQLNWYNKNNAL